MDVTTGSGPDPLKADHPAAAAESPPSSLATRRSGADASRVRPAHGPTPETGRPMPPPHNAGLPPPAPAHAQAAHLTAQLSDASFKLVKAIGNGTVGTAYKAVRLADRLVVCIKKVDVSGLTDDERRRAHAEASILASLKSPYVVRYLDAYVSDATVNIVMEYMPHGTLLDRIRNQRGRRFSERVIWRYFLQVASGLNHIHSQGVLHRDLKSTNVLIGANDECRIIDLGSAVVLEARGQLTATTVGTPYYLAPELCLDKPYGEKADVWALGCILYELLCLRYPFHAGDQAALVVKILEGKYDPPASAYSPELVALLRDLLTQDPVARPSVGSVLSEPSIAAKCSQVGVTTSVASAITAASATFPTAKRPSGLPPQRTLPPHSHAPLIMRNTPPPITIPAPAGKTPDPLEGGGSRVHEVTGNAIRGPPAVRRRTSTGRPKGLVPMAQTLGVEHLSPNKTRHDKEVRMQMQWTDAEGMADMIRSARPQSGTGTPPQHHETQRQSAGSDMDGEMGPEVVIGHIVDHEVFSPSNLRLLPSWWRAHAQTHSTDAGDDLSGPVENTMEPIANKKYAGLIDPLALPRCTSTPPETWNSPFHPTLSPRKRRFNDEGTGDVAASFRRSAAEIGSAAPVPKYLPVGGASGAAALARRAIDSPRCSWSGSKRELHQLALQQHAALPQSHSGMGGVEALEVNACAPAVPLHPAHERAGRLVPLPHGRLADSRRDEAIAPRAKADSPVPIVPVLHRRTIRRRGDNLDHSSADLSLKMHASSNKALSPLHEEAHRRW